MTVRNPPTATSMFVPAIEIAKVLILLGRGGVAAFAASYLRDRTFKLILRIQHESRVRALFGQHVSRAVVDELLAAKPVTESATRKVCVMFLDVRGFTGFSEKKTPQDVVEYLNSLFSFMVEVVDRNRGVVNKFLGDG